MEGLEIGKLLGRKTLIVGEAGTGKSHLLARILEKMVEALGPEEITVIDMAPFRSSGIGGKLRELTESVKRVKYLTDDRIAPPRLAGRNATEVLKLAERNASLIRPLLLEFLKRPTRILLVNDLTIYLHAGDSSLLEEVLEAAETFVATCYEGELLSDDKGSGITAIERTRLNELRGRVDDVLVLRKPFIVRREGSVVDGGEVG
jgi:GTPase SAR1 family protein